MKNKNVINIYVYVTNSNTSPWTIKIPKLSIMFCILQTVVMINAYLNPQNAALTADGSHSM